MGWTQTEIVTSIPYATATEIDDDAGDNLAWASVIMVRIGVLTRSLKSDNTIDMSGKKYQMVGDMDTEDSAFTVADASSIFDTNIISAMFKSAIE